MDRAVQGVSTFALLSPGPPIPPSTRVFSNESAIRIRWPKDWSFSFSISPSNECSGLIFFSLAVQSPCNSGDSQESSPVAQFESINFSALSFLNGPTLTSVHDYWKNDSFDYMDLCWPLEKGKATYSSILAWRMPRTVHGITESRT